MSKAGRKRKIGIRRQPNGQAEPGRAVPTYVAVHNRHTLVEKGKRSPAPMVRGGLMCTFREVEGRLLRAMRTLRALPDRERRFFVQKSCFPEYAQEFMDAYASVEERMPRFMPTPSDISDCLPALELVRHLENRQWKLIWWRSFGLSFGLMAEYIGRSDETVRRRYREAITDAWAAANAH